MTRLLASLLLVALLALAGCGSSGDDPTESDRVATEETTETAEDTDTTEPTDTVEEPEEVEVPDGAVAVVGDGPITQAEFERFNRQALAAQGGRPSPSAKQMARDQVMKFVISARWLELEAEAREVTASEDEVDRAFAKEKRKAFPTEADYQRFLKTSGNTEASTRYRVKIDLLSDKLKKALGKGGDINSFAKAFRQKYKAQTVCAEEFEVAECGSTG